jgi:hypothetical protein
VKLLNAAEILERDDSQFEDVSVPEWGGTVRVRSLTADERDAFDESITKISNNGRGQTREIIMKGIRSKLVARSLIDDKGGRLFTDAQIETLGAKNANVLDRLFATAQRLSGLSKDDVEKMAGKSAPAPSSSSSTG